MKAIKVKISEWHYAMLKSMEATTQHTKRNILENKIVALHSAILFEDEEGNIVLPEGKAYLEADKEFNIDNLKGL